MKKREEVRRKLMAFNVFSAYKGEIREALSSELDSPNLSSSCYNAFQRVNEEIRLQLPLTLALEWAFSHHREAKWKACLLTEPVILKAQPGGGDAE